MSPMLRRTLRYLARRRSLFATSLELTGFALVTIAAWEVSHPLGLFTAGALLVVIAIVLEAGRR